MIALLISLAMAATLQNVGLRNEGCRVACIRSGFDGGQAKGKGCMCLTFTDDYDLFVHNRINLGVLDVRHTMKNETIKVDLDY